MDIDDPELFDPDLPAPDLPAPDLPAPDPGWRSIQFHQLGLCIELN
jgi:hypothetical protein